MEAIIMMGKPNKLEPKLFYHGISLDRRISADHPLRNINKLVNFTFIRSKVADLYGTRGNPSVDPAVILKMKEYIEWADSSLSKHARKRLIARRKHKAEGSFADAANNHGFKRSRFRGIEKMKIQNLMIVAIQNLRKLILQRHLQ
jgi:transposase